MAEESRRAWPVLIQTFEMVSHLRNGRRLEKTQDLDLDVQVFMYAEEKLGRQKRVATQDEEVIMDTNLFEFEHVRAKSRLAASRADVRGATKIRRRCRHCSRLPTSPPGRHASLCRSGLWESP